jgi:RNA polymerase sigma-70 factor (ECF subfamily)
VQAFYQAQVGLVYRYVYQRVRNHQEAEDLTSEIFLKVAGGLDTTRGAKTAKRWLIELTRTTLADYWRARARVTICSLEALLDTGWEGPLEEPPSTGTLLIRETRPLCYCAVG